MTTTTAHTAAPFLYVDVDIPVGQTLAEWRRAHAAPVSHRPVRRALRRAMHPGHRAH